MCGLAGVIDLKGRREPDRAQVAHMGAALTHRGPDETGTLFAPGIGAIQQRLSIVGLGNGQQPIFNEDRTVAVDLQRRAVRLSRAQGRAAGARPRLPRRQRQRAHRASLRGARRGSVPAAQGPVRLRAVRLRQAHRAAWRATASASARCIGRGRATVFYFASEIKALLASGAVPAAADRAGSITSSPSSRSARAARCSKACSRSARATISRSPSGSDGGAGRDRRAALLGPRFPRRGRRAGCRRPNGADRRVRGDLPPCRRDSAARRRAGGRLSLRRRRLRLRAGHGLEAARRAAAELHHPGAGMAELDESGRMRRITARAIGGRPTVVDADGDRHRRQLCGADRAPPSARCSTPRARRCSRCRARCTTQGYKVVLTGEGADEAFAGYVWFKIREAARDLDTWRRVRIRARRSAGCARKCAAPKSSFGEFARIDEHDRRTARAVASSIISSRRRATAITAPSMKERLGDSSPMRTSSLDLERMRRWHPLNQLALSRLQDPACRACLMTQKGDRVAMANSRRDALPVPRRGRDRVCLAASSALEAARAARRQISAAPGGGARAAAEVAWRRKKAMFRAPLAETFLAKPPAFVRDLISPESLAAHRLFRRAAASRATARRWPGRGRSSARSRASASAAWSPPSSGTTSISAADCASCRISSISVSARRSAQPPSSLAVACHKLPHRTSLRQIVELGTLMSYFTRETAQLGETFLGDGARQVVGVQVAAKARAWPDQKRREIAGAFASRQSCAERDRSLRGEREGGGCPH